MAESIKIKNGDTENTIWSFLRKEIWLIGVVIGGVLFIYLPIAKIQTDIAVINSNHETHMQDAIAQIQKLEEEQKEQNIQITDLLKQTVETQTLIKLHMGIK